jgi:hypothetical protein
VHINFVHIIEDRSFQMGARKLAGLSMRPSKNKKVGGYCLSLHSMIYAHREEGLVQDRVFYPTSKETSNEG